MRLLDYGADAVLAELPNGVDVPALRNAALDLPGVLEAVAGARTVLVEFDLSLTSGPAVRAGLLSAQLVDVTVGGADEVVVPVHYDGADLADVARRAGLSPAEVIARHTAPVYTVPVLRLRARLRLPRRPRPAAARAAAPHPAGGGSSWGRGGGRRVHRDLPALLTGRLAAPRPDRPRTVGHRGPPAGPPPARHAGPLRADMIEIVEPGPLTTVQDEGRVGYRALGVACSARVRSRRGGPGEPARRQRNSTQWRPRDHPRWPRVPGAGRGHGGVDQGKPCGGLKLGRPDHPPCR